LPVVISHAARTESPLSLRTGQGDDHRSFDPQTRSIRNVIGVEVHAIQRVVMYRPAVRMIVRLNTDGGNSKAHLEGSNSVSGFVISRGFKLSPSQPYPPEPAGSVNLSAHRVLCFSDSVAVFAFAHGKKSAVRWLAYRSVLTKTHPDP